MLMNIIKYYKTSYRYLRLLGVNINLVNYKIYIFGLHLINKFFFNIAESIDKNKKD